MMTRDPRDKSPSAKQEPGLQDVDHKTAATSVRARATSRSWPGLKDPRIVRVSRAFGGKDRHSKVSTVRGLRDRRVRLSVQTAIQLYDLQDRLGLSQPSKVVDWLLDAAQHEIDKLPPLQIPPGSCLIQYPLAHSAVASHGALGLPQARPSASSMAALNMEHMEENGAGSLVLLPDREGSYDRDHVELQMAPLPRDQHHGVEDIPVHSNLHRLGFLSMPSSSNGSNSSNSYASYCLLEASNLFAPPHLAGYSMTQAEESHGYRSIAPPTPSLSLSHASQLLPSLFSPYVATTTSTDHYEPKHANSSSTIFQLMGSSTASQNSKHQQFWNGGQESVDEG